MTTKRSRRDGRKGGETWLVLSRDLSDSVSVAGEPQVRGAMVLEIDTGLVRAVAVGATENDALTQAFEMGLAEPAPTILPGRPDEVWCAAELEAQVVDILSRLVSGDALPAVRATEPPAEAEDIFDSFVGHLSGRLQPDEQPSPSDWELMYRQAFDFYRAAPWTRWHDGIVLDLQTSIENTHGGWAAVVMGNSGIQYGLVLYPGGQMPAGLEDWEPGMPIPMPPGTLSLMLDPPLELPSDLRNKGLRYGWPPEAELEPGVLRLDEQGGGDPGAADVQLLAVALAAVTAHDTRGLVAVGSADQATKGAIVLGNGHTASFSIAQKPPTSEPEVPRFRVHQTGFDLVPQGTPVVLGHLSWASVIALRSAARIHRPLPSGAPQPAGTEVPLFAILPNPNEGEAMAAKVAELDPFGVAVVRIDQGNDALVLGGTNDSQLLMEVPANSPGMSDFRRRMRATKGLHIVMVADEATSRGEGTVYGFFECHQPLLKASRQSDKRRSAAPSKRKK